MNEIMAHLLYAIIAFFPSQMCDVTMIPLSFLLPYSGFAPPRVGCSRSMVETYLVPFYLTRRLDRNNGIRLTTGDRRRRVGGTDVTDDLNLCNMSCGIRSRSLRR